MSERTRARKAISVLLGIFLAVGGMAWFVYMLLFTVESVKILFWMMPTTTCGAGVAVLWDDIKNP